jgi:hypothetical protein
MKNEHLIPPIVIDLVDKSNSPYVRENEKVNYILRIEAIRDYCTVAINKHNSQKALQKTNSRRTQ